MCNGTPGMPGCRARRAPAQELSQRVLPWAFACPNSRTSPTPVEAGDPPQVRGCRSDRWLRRTQERDYCVFDVDAVFADVYAANLDALIERARAHVRREEDVQARLLQRNDGTGAVCCFDRQVQVPGTARRLDLVGVLAADVPAFVAIEVKRYPDNSIQEVPRQLHKYLEVLDPTREGLRDDIARSYRTVCGQLRTLGLPAPDPTHVVEAMPVMGLVVVSDYDPRSVLIARAHGSPRRSIGPLICGSPKMGISGSRDPSDGSVWNWIRWARVHGGLLARGLPSGAGSGTRFDRQASGSSAEGMAEPKTVAQHSEFLAKERKVRVRRGRGPGHKACDGMRPSASVNFVGDSAAPAQRDRGTTVSAQLRDPWQPRIPSRFGNLITTRNVPVAALGDWCGSRSFP